MRLVRIDRPATQTQILSHGRPDALGQHDRRNRREHAEPDLRLPERRVRACDDPMTERRQFESTAETRSAHSRERDDRRIEHGQHERMKSPQHVRSLIRQMFLDARPVRELRAVPFQDDRADRLVLERRVKGLGQRFDGRSVEDIALRFAERDAPEAGLNDLT